MKYDDDSLVNPPMEKLLEKIPQRYELVLTATRRAKQIIREQRLNPMATSDENRQRKPLNIALTDILEGRIDQQALMAPDIELDDFEQDSFSALDSKRNAESPEDGIVMNADGTDQKNVTDDAENPTSADDDADDSDFSEVDDMFGLEDDDSAKD